MSSYATEQWGRQVAEGGGYASGMPAAIAINIRGQQETLSEALASIGTTAVSTNNVYGTLDDPVFVPRPPVYRSTPQARKRPTPRLLTVWERIDQIDSPIVRRIERSSELATRFAFCKIDDLCAATPFVVELAVRLLCGVALGVSLAAYGVPGVTACCLAPCGCLLLEVTRYVMLRSLKPFFRVSLVVAGIAAAAIILAAIYPVAYALAWLIAYGVTPLL